MSMTRTVGAARCGNSAARWVLGLLLGACVPLAALAQTTVTTIGGGPNQLNPNPNGFVNGDTLQTAQFDTPGGLVFDTFSGRYLFLADTGNGAVRRLDLTAGRTITYLSGLSTPVDLAMDGNTNLYVLTQGDGRIRQYDQFGQLIATNNATLLATPTALAYDGVGSLYVVELGGALKRVTLAGGAVTTIKPAGTFNAPRGVEVLDSGNLVVSDTGNHAIQLVSPTTFAVTLLSGSLGVSGTNIGTATQTRFSSPNQIAKAGGGTLVVADQGNHRVMLVASNGSSSVLYGVASNLWESVPGNAAIRPGWANGTAEFAESRTPTGVVVDNNGNVYVTEQYYDVVRRASGAGLTSPGGPTAPLLPPTLSFTPNSGYFPLGARITVTSSSGNVFFTTDGTAPTTNSTAVTMAGGTGTFVWNNPTNDLSGLRVTAFAFSGTNSVSTTVAGVTVTESSIGVPPGVNTSIMAGPGAQIVVPVVVNLRSNDTLRSLQFRVEVSANGGAPVIGPIFSPLDIGTNDFVKVASSSSLAHLSAFNYTAGPSVLGMSISFLGTNGNLSVTRFGVVAMLRVQIPAGAAVGSTYNVDVLQPSGTSDGAQASVTIKPASTQTILVTNLPYIVGDTSPGGWYNAGDFGNTNLDNADVNNAFAAAAGLRVPYTFSDAFDAMDAFPEDTGATVGGDGQIRFLDWQIILLRSLRLNSGPGLGISQANWSRRWVAGARTTGMTNLTPAAVRAAAVTPPGLVWNKQAAIGALPLENVQPGAMVLVPVFVRVAPGAMVSGLQFRAVVTPSAGAPAPAQAPQFIALNSLLNPTLVSGLSNAVAAGWNVGQLALPALSSNLLGFVEFTVPQTAAAGSTYAVSFANADGSPNLFTQYDFETRGATVWVQRPAAAPPSLISDEWKIQFFGSTTDPRADDLADPDGDGVPNVLEYFAGTNPTNPNSKVQVQNGGLSNGGQTLSLQLLSAPSKYYVLEGSPSVVGGTWTPVATNLGDGNVQQFIQAVTPGGPRYYRLRVIP